MNVFDKIQPYVSSEDGILFDVSLNTDDVSFEILELTHDDIIKLVGNIMEQVHLLWEAYHDSEPKVNEK